MKKPGHYIVVDDDRTSNMICELVIKKFDKESSVNLFNSPEEALMNIENSYFTNAGNRIFLFLDVNMPSMTGWEFLDVFQKMDIEIQKQFDIYILSSAIQDFSKEIEGYPVVKGFLSKPLNTQILSQIVVTEETDSQ